jgi:hypothetical protein
MVKKKRKINRAFNNFIAPRLSDIDHVQLDRNAKRNADWVRKGAPK